MTEKYWQTKKREKCQRGQESNRMDDIIKDTIIVSKIKEKDPVNFEEIEEGLIHDGKVEKEQIAAEYEAIVKKQLQMLQANERGTQAIQNEIIEIRRKQEKRAEALKNRVKALEIEKERAKKIASRPPPLRRSIRLMLKEQAKKDAEYLSEDISPLEDVFEDIESLEDKENVDEEYLAEKRKTQEEWDKKAQKRFNEALKKDRQKQTPSSVTKNKTTGHPMSTPEVIKMDDTLVPLVSGTLSNLQTPKHLISDIQFLPGDQISSLSSITDTQLSNGGSGSRDLRTPSPVSTLESASATKSQAFPYSSSLWDSKTTQSPLVSSSGLSKYFQDISSIRHASESSSKSSRLSPTPVQMDARRQVKLQESSPGTFLPMTPHSFLSTLGESSRKEKDHSITKRSHLTPKKNKDIQANFKTPDSDPESFKPMTPHSCFSSGSKHQSLNAKPFSPIKGSQQVSRGNASSRKNIDDSDPDSFKPLSLMTNVSTPKDSFVDKNFISNENYVQFLDKNEEYQCDNTAGSKFQPMTPHSYFSSDSKTTSKHPSVNKKPFPLRKDNQQGPCSGVSSPDNFDESNEHSFKPLSLLSNVSTPRDAFMREDIISSEKDVQFLDRNNEGYQCESSSSSSFQPMTSHSYFSSPSNATASGIHKLNEFSIGKELKDGSVNVRLKIPIPFNRAASPTHEDQRSSGPKSFTYPIRLVLDTEDILNSFKDTENCKVDSSCAKQNTKVGLSEGNPSEKQILSSKTPPKNHSDLVNTAIKHATNDKIVSKIPSSGFVPKFSPQEFASLKKNKIDKDLFAMEMSTKNAAADISSINPGRSLYSTNNAIALSNPKKTLNNSSVINNDLRILPNVTGSVEQERGISSSSHGQVHMRSTSPNPILQALSQRGPKPPYVHMSHRLRRDGTIRGTEFIRIHNERCDVLNSLFEEYVTGDPETPRITAALFRRVTGQFLGRSTDPEMLLNDRRCDLNEVAMQQLRRVFNEGQFAACMEGRKTVLDRDVTKTIEDFRLTVNS